jgi:hypothetical protein
MQVFCVADLQAFPYISIPSAPLSDLVQIDTAPRRRGPMNALYEVIKLVRTESVTLKV